MGRLIGLRASRALGSEGSGVAGAEARGSPGFIDLALGFIGFRGLRV